MLIYLYLFALVLGGVLLGASVLLGGKETADTDGDADGDADAHADGLDKSFDKSLDKGITGEKSLDAGGIGSDFFLWTLRSIRFWTFFLAFFGMTGLALQGLGLVASQWVTLALALSMGGVTGFGAAGVIRWLSRDQSAAAASESDYIGKSARVLVPVGREGLGKVRVQIKGTSVDVLATTDEDRPFESQEEAMIIEMDGTRARIARVERSGSAGD